MPKISSLPPLTEAAGDDQIAVVDTSAGETKKLPVNSIMPVGAVVDFAGSTPPDGWLLCYGQALDASVDTQYQALYDAIGNEYGGSDYTDFQLPDVRGRVVAGKDNMGGSSADRLTDQSGGVDGDVLGDTGGDETHTLTEAEMPSHHHTLTYRAPNDTTGGGYLSVQGQTNQTTGTADPGTNETGGDDPHNNVQPTIILNKIIKF